MKIKVKQLLDNIIDDPTHYNMWYNNQESKIYVIFNYYDMKLTCMFNDIRANDIDHSLYDQLTEEKRNSYENS
jgi:hypothetical protein